MSGGIYEIRNKVTGKYYVGRAERFTVRFNRHRYELRHGRHHCLHLQRAWQKYGEDNFAFVVVLECGIQEATEIEQLRLDTRDARMYNIGRGATGGDLISQHPQRASILARMSETLIQRFARMSEEERSLIYGRPGELNGMYGRRHSAESRRKMSETTLRAMKRGEAHHNFGLVRSDQTRRRMSEIASARTGPANSFYGKRHTEETRALIAAKKRGGRPSNERPVLVGAVEYPSVTEAARQLGVSPALVIYRIKSPKYDFRYNDKTEGVNA